MRILDDFDDIGAWRVAASDEVEASLRRVPRGEGSALCLDFDFGQVSGYAVLRRELSLEYPENYELAFDIRGDAPENALQFKLVDASGENVWWVNRADFAFPRDWERIRLKKRHIEFAWGPSRDRSLARSAVLELVIARGRGGGKGSVCFDRLTMSALPVAAGATTPLVQASSTFAPSHPADVVDGKKESAWRSDPSAGPRQTLTLDFGQPREFGGLVLHWSADAFASRYTIELSDDGERWRTVRRVNTGNGGADSHLLTESEARFIRLHLEDGPAKHYALREIEIKDPAYGASANAFFATLAREAPRGHYPRGFTEQTYWTVLGIDGGTRHGLLSEDGALELGPLAGSVEPFLLTEDGLVTWADAAIEHSLLDRYLPIPTVTWRERGLTLRVTAFGMGDPTRSQLMTSYTLENHTDRPRVVTLVLAIRPFQVNPPTQLLNLTGGVAPMRELSWNGHALSIDGAQRLFPLRAPDEVVTLAFDAGNLPEILAGRTPIAGHAVSDDTGFASGGLSFRLTLPPRGSERVGIVSPLVGAPMLATHDTMSWFDREQANVAAQWREKTNRVSLRVPPAGQPMVDTLRTALAHILISRDGARLHPGTRAYARSWVRDGAMMADALLRLGHAQVGREYIDWFAPHQFASGKVPCCVDQRGSDPVAENDSHGQLIYLVAEHYRFTRDRAWLKTMWPHIKAAAAYMNTSRLTERTAANQTLERRAFYGLMPASISHEGYSDKPAYSYWDDFWALTGYDSAVSVARVLGLAADASRLARERDEFSRDLHASLAASMAYHRIDFIPGSADRGDFDSTSTTIALSIAGQQAHLPRQPLERTFERYWEEFLARRAGRKEWHDYTPYELRAVSAFVRLGWRKRATALLDYFMADRRPAGWNQWAEVVGREARERRFVGDMPHGWIASDYIRAALDSFVYERAADRTLILGAGIPVEWLEGDGIAIERLRTPYGELGFSIKRDGPRLTLAIAAGLTPPSGGVVFKWPYQGRPGQAFSNGRPMRWQPGQELRIRSLPAVIEIKAP